MPAEALQQIDARLWRLDSHFTKWGCKGSIRATFIETARGLVIYSPVHLSQAHIEAIRTIGAVTAIVAPNLYHHLYLRACMAAFPEARVFVPKGLAEKIGPLQGAEEMTEASGIAPYEELDFHIFAGHKLRETLLFHHETGTLISADLLYNFQPENFSAEKRFFRLIGCYGEPSVPFYHRFAIEDKAAVRALIRKVRRWPVRRIVMSHGRIVEDEAGAEIFAKAWRRFA